MGIHASGAKCRCDDLKGVSLKTATQRKKVEKRVAVSASTLRSSAKRLIAQGTLVTQEVDYIQRSLGAFATQQQIDDSVIAVRKLPWASIALPE